jgi:hypothetical protein
MMAGIIALIIAMAVALLVAISRKRGKQKVPTEKDVVVKRDFEYFCGFVRFKVSVENKMDTVITDVFVSLVFDDNVFRLNHIEPNYKLDGREVKVGNINPNEKKTVAFYLDPMMCTTSYVEGVVALRDTSGTVRTVTMEKKDIGIVCPIFFTEEIANIAVLKNLVNALPYQDTKVFKIPAGLKTQDAFTLCKEVVQHHDIKFVREFIEKTPFVGEAWYYGLTKIKKHQVVIQASVRQDTNSIMLFAACADPMILTGLLAELGHDLENKIAEKGIAPNIQQITNITIKDSVIHKSSLLFGTDIVKNLCIQDSVVTDSHVGK